MDIDKKSRQAARRVIISEAIMVVAVIVIVLLLAFIVSGYWLGSDFKIERQGLLQVYSVPTGANVEIDDNPSSWLQRTNTSKTLSAGEHTIVLTKDGYDSWSRTININEGLLYRLHYPRLFLKNRVKESAYDFSGNFASVSPDRNTLLLAGASSTWQTLNLDSASVKPVDLDLSKVLPFVNVSSVSNPDKANEKSLASGVFSGEILESYWASDNEHILLRLRDNSESLPEDSSGSVSGAESSSSVSVVENPSNSSGAENWLILNVKNPASSINLTKTFNANFSRVEILDNSASNLLVVMNGNLHRIDVSARQISAVLIPNIYDYDYYDQEIVFSAKVSADKFSHAEEKTREMSDEEKLKYDEDSKKPYYIGLFRLGNSEITDLEFTNDKKRVIIYKFYDEQFVGVIDDENLVLHLKTDYDEQKTTYNLNFTPDKIKVISDGDAVILYSGGAVMTLDMESMELNSWNTETDEFGWLDKSMIYAIKDETLNAYDFNGLNHRTLSSGLSSSFPVTITADKYLYYFSGNSLIREYLYEK